MYHEHRCHLVAADHSEVRAHLAQRPASWLRPFLRLATNGAPSGPGTSAATTDPWFRLAKHQGDGEGPMRMIWHPHRPSPVFESFDGHLECRPAGDGTDLVLAGECSGGDPAVTDLILRTTVELLCDALAGAITPDS